MKRTFDSKLNAITSLIALKRAWLDCGDAFEDLNIDCNDYIVENYPFEKSFTDIDVSEWVESSIDSLYASFKSQEATSERDDCMMYNCFTCPYGKESYKTSIAVYNALGEQPNHDDILHNLWCDKVGGKVGWCGYCDDAFGKEYLDNPDENIDEKITDRIKKNIIYIDWEDIEKINKIIKSKKELYIEDDGPYNNKLIDVFRGRYDNNMEIALKVCDDREPYIEIALFDQHGHEVGSRVPKSGDIKKCYMLKHKGVTYITEIQPCKRD